MATDTPEDSIAALFATWQRRKIREARSIVRQSELQIQQFTHWWNRHLLLNSGSSLDTNPVLRTPDSCLGTTERDEPWSSGFTPRALNAKSLTTAVKGSTERGRINPAAGYGTALEACFSGKTDTPCHSLARAVIFHFARPGRYLQISFSSAECYSLRAHLVYAVTACPGKSHSQPPHRKLGSFVCHRTQQTRGGQSVETISAASEDCAVYILTVIPILIQVLTPQRAYSGVVTPAALLRRASASDNSGMRFTCTKADRSCPIVQLPMRELHTWFQRVPVSQPVRTTSNWGPNTVVLISFCGDIPMDRCHLAAHHAKSDHPATLPPAILGSCKAYTRFPCTPKSALGYLANFEERDFVVQGTPTALESLYLSMT